MDKIKVWLEKDCPSTNAILGALLSGGNPIKLAEMLVKEKKKEQREKYERRFETSPNLD